MAYVNGCQPQRHLGFAIAAAAPIAAATGPLAPFVLAGALIGSLLPFVPEIGGGRKEADKITPTQNQLGDTLGQVDQILSTQTLSASQLQQLGYQLQGIWDTFVAFLYQPAFTADGDTRASDQSKADMEPQVNARLDRIRAMINAVLGRPNVPTMMQSGGPAAIEFRTTSDLSLPQAGFNQVGAVQPMGPQVIGPAGGMDTGLLLKLAVAAGVVLVISRR